MGIRRRGRAVGAVAVASLFMTGLGLDTALAVCASPATQLTTGQTETAVVTFGNVNNGNSPVTVAGLSLSCSSNAGSASVAAFYANSGTGAVPNSCTKSGTLTGWTSGAVSGSTVTFTSTTPNQNVANISTSGSASASTTNGSSGTLSAALSGNTVCVGSAGNWNNQEYHSGTGGGSIVDYKQGPTDSKDPSATIGTWNLSSNQVNYAYTAGGNYSFTVWQQTNNTYDFCNLGTAVVSGATIKTGGPSPC